MVIESKDGSGATPATARGTPRAESNSAIAIITQADARVDLAIHFDDFKASDQHSKEDGNADDNDDVKFRHEAEEHRCMWATSSTLAGLIDVTPTIATEKKMVVKVRISVSDLR